MLAHICEYQSSWWTEENYLFIAAKCVSGVTANKNILPLLNAINMDGKWSLFIIFITIITIMISPFSLQRVKFTDRKS